ncbi:MAG TPA: O-antigen ligase family protein [Candidatus Polarisedimenticolia bacterium]|nr:O-antigen ligase family protein [Candidatus Polarisedimenticolia bacterium]
MQALARALVVRRDRPHLLVLGIALFLLLATVVLGVSVPTVFTGLAILAAALATLIKPEIGVHVLVVNALVGLTHVMEMPRIGPLSAPIVIEAFLMAALAFQAAFLRKRVPFGTLQHLLMGLLAAWILISLFAGAFVGPDNFQEYRNLFLVRLVIFLLVSGVMTTLAHVRRLIATFMISNVGLLAVAGAVRLGYFGQEKVITSQELERTGALVQNPNELAFHLTTMMVLCVFTLLGSRSMTVKLAMLALAAADLFGIMSTLSRSGFISMCVVVAFLLVKLTRNVRALGVMALLLAAGWLMVPEALFTRFARIDEVKDVDRVKISQVGAAMALDNPVTGVGLGNYVKVFWDYNVSNMKRAAPSHNMYLDLAAQMGLPALGLYLAILVVTWRGVRKVERDLAAQGRTRSFAYLFALAMQAFLVNLAVFGLSGDVEFDYSAFVLLGMTLTLLRAHREGRTLEGASPAEAR